MSRVEASPEVRRELSLIYAQTPQHRSRVVGAVAMIERALAISKAPYVAFTSGKDSMVVASLVERIARGVILAWSDDELEFPETVEMMGHLVDSLEFVVTSGWTYHADWFAPWTDPPFWREPFPEMRWIEIPQDDWMARDGHDLTFLGTRAEESRKRRDWLFNAFVRWGGVYPVASGTGKRCCPIWDWTADDVWAYIATHNLPVNPVYNTLEAIGVDRKHQRLGPLPLARRSDLEAGWPDLLARLEERYGKRWR